MCLRNMFGFVLIIVMMTSSLAIVEMGMGLANDADGHSSSSLSRNKVPSVRLDPNVPIRSSVKIPRIPHGVVPSEMDEIGMDKDALETQLALNVRKWKSGFLQDMNVLQKEIRSYALNLPPAGGFIIDGDKDLINKSATYGWAGDGSASNPFIISGYRFSSTSGDPCNFSKIDIFNTTLHLKIIKNNFEGISCPNTPGKDWDGGFAIRLKAARNVAIENNSFIDIRNDAVLMQNTSFVTIKNNAFTNVTRGAIYAGDIGFPLLSLELVNISIVKNSFNQTGIYHPNPDEIFGNIRIDTGTARAYSITVRGNSFLDGRGDYGVFLSSIFEGWVTDNFFYNLSTSNAGSASGASNIYAWGDDSIVISNNIIRRSVNMSGVVVYGGNVTVEANEISFNSGVPNRLTGIFNALDVGIDAVAFEILLVRNNTVISNTYLAALYMYAAFDLNFDAADGNWTITNNTFSYNDATGIWVEGNPHFDEYPTIYILDNAINTNKRHGLLLGSIDDVSVQSNSLSYNRMNGILLYSVNNSYFGYNDIYGNDLSGINSTFLQYNFAHPYAYFMDDNPSSNNWFEWNDVLENRKDGFSIGQGWSFVIRNTNLIDNRRYGIYAISGANSTLQFSTVRNNTLDGLYISTNKWNVSDNLISENGKAGISLSFSATNTTIVNNIISNQSGNGIEIQFNPNNTRIEMNRIEGNELDGINSSSSNMTISRNFIRFNGGDGIDAIGNRQTIKNNTVTDNGQNGLLLSRALNGTVVVDNIIERNIRGIHIVQAVFDAMEIQNNRIWDNSIGINATDIQYLDIPVAKLSILNNDIAMNYEGIFVSDINGDLEVIANQLDLELASGDRGGPAITILNEFQSVNISQNEIKDALHAAISIKSNSTYGKIDLLTNVIEKIFGEGILIETQISSGLLTIEKNQITRAKDGIFINGFYGTGEIADNTIKDGRGTGVFLDNVNNTMVRYNGVYNNRKYALLLGSNSTNSVVSINDFSFNLRSRSIPPHTSQAIDNGTNNNFTANFWNDWTSPDQNGDGYVDFPYSINGTALNQDPLPRALRPTPISHLLLKPFISFPNGGETVSGSVNVSWLPAIDTASHQITYDLYYSSDGGTTWLLIAGSLIHEFFVWDTTQLPDGPNYLIKVIAKDGSGLETDDESDSPFAISNGGGVIHELSLVTLLFPNGGEVLNGTITISWTAVNDSFGHPINYTLFYTRDGGLTWMLLATNLTGTSYLWDTSTIPDGSYLLKVQASDGFGLVVEDISDSTFSVLNTVLSSSPVSSTTTSSTVSSPISSFESSVAGGGFIPSLTIELTVISLCTLSFAFRRKRSPTR
ncbi:MAG: hypothetical protein D6732_11850 [Methanobacteriota archaeon]|nr:MAG: hypothetical protein D6732_11850 [Euryarchaeota archaeon]